MRERKISVRDKIGSMLVSSAVIVDGHETLSMGGVKVKKGIDTIHGFEVFFDGVDRDIEELGSRGALKLYRGIIEDPARLRDAIGASLRISRILDADLIAGR
jgi:hypothetical protein